jgi:HlyD family secretion protein
MRRWIIGLILLALIGVGGAIGVPKAQSYWKERNRPKFRVSKVTRGPVAWEVRTSGTVQPVLRVSIGSFVSGPVSELHANFNDFVKKGQILAKIDPRIYSAAVRRDEAALAVANADVLRVLANLQLSRNDERRSQKLRDINPEYISDTEMDQFRYAREALEAQLEIAKESAKQAQGRLDDSKANLQYTEIVAPCDGVVIDRKIDEGQTLAAQFQTPELFVLAPDQCPGPGSGHWDGPAREGSWSKGPIYRRSLSG